MKLSCPKCKKEFEFEKTSDIPSFPFCSKQCKLIDLGRWLNESHALPSYSNDIIHDYKEDENEE